jgi:hypothetical protein
MEKQGYTAEEIARGFDGNWMRVYGEAWNSRDRVAAVRQMGAQGRTRLR